MTTELPSEVSSGAISGATSGTPSVSGVGMASRARPEILAMKGYVSARSLVASGDSTVFLDANECPYEPYVGASGLARYPMQQPPELIRVICDWLDLSSRNVTVMRGADEAIDCLMRAFCEPARDNIVICPPTFAMYRQSAILQGVEVREAPLAAGFALDNAAVLAQCDDSTKLVFVCSPNNPTANLMDRDAVLELCATLDGRALVVVDETYIEYAGVESVAAALENHANLVVLRTLSKSHAAAGVRCGVAVARADVSAVLAKVLAPYPIPQPVVQAVMAIMAPSNLAKLADRRREIITRRDVFATAARETAPVREVLPTDANYLLMIVDDAEALCARAGEAGIILRNQSHQPGLANAVRVSIGTDEEMSVLLAVLRGEAVPARGEERVARHVRRTSETAISVEVNLDRKAPVRISTGVGFYDHMLDQIAKHAGFSLQLECDGDLHIDPHHTVEDCAIALGVALRSALGDKRGIGRYGFCLPMDESLVTVALDLSGRYYLDFKGDFPADHVGDLPTDMIEHVFRSLAENLQANLHIEVEGENAHHMVEACFKGFARALRQAIRQDGGDLPSTKGML
jgi:histidinol-phosphate aminotransferase/imidazoleglycerol-phosphate dehydratase/histidinol-phosphatase